MERHEIRSRSRCTSFFHLRAESWIRWWGSSRRVVITLRGRKEMPFQWASETDHRNDQNEVRSPSRAAGGHQKKIKVSQVRRTCERFRNFWRFDPPVVSNFISPHSFFCFERLKDVRSSGMRRRVRVCVITARLMRFFSGWKNTRRGSGHLTRRAPSKMYCQSNTSVLMSFLFELCISWRPSSIWTKNAPSDASTESDSRRAPGERCVVFMATTTKMIIIRGWPVWIAVSHLNIRNRKVVLLGASHRLKNGDSPVEMLYLRATADWSFGCGLGIESYDSQPAVIDQQYFDQGYAPWWTGSESFENNALSMIPCKNYTCSSPLVSRLQQPCPVSNQKRSAAIFCWCAQLSCFPPTWIHLGRTRLKQTHIFIHVTCTTWRTTHQKRWVFTTRI